jgi:pyruvate dehydrogenase E2 component (dihydrolipoamide acetyltransferase)
MPALLRMPGVAANATDAVLSEWQVAENAEFTKEDAIATVETDKANVDIEAEEAGVILKYLVPPGTTVEVGAPIALTGLPGESVTDLERALRDLGVSTQENPGDTDPGDVPVEARAARTDSQDRAADYAGADGARLFVTPLVRRLVREADLDLNGITGTGPNGRIVKRDITDLLATGPRRVTPTPVAVTADVPVSPAPKPTPSAPPQGGYIDKPQGGYSDKPQGGYTDEPHSRMRKAIASRLTTSKQTAPHFYVRGTAEVDGLLALRKSLVETTGVKVSVNDLIVKAAARAHVLVPAMNVIWLDDAVRSFDTVDIAVAVASDRGLMTPVVRDVARRSIGAVAADISDVAERARDGKLGQDELEGGSLSISNLGMFGTEEFSAIINPPHAAILAVGAARPEAVVHDGELAVASVLKVTLSVDHRPVDGVVAAEWMAAFLDVLHTPVTILI